VLAKSGWLEDIAGSPVPLEHRVIDHSPEVCICVSCLDHKMKGAY
jgi:hypothetical protein